MRLAHLADPHLGIRQYHRQTAAGINQREADVAQAFRSAVDGVIAARPDAVLLAGDLFHSVRPTNAAIVFAFQQLQRLRAALPDAPVVLIAGNHDTPRSSETGSILRLYEELGVDVAAQEARRFSYPTLGLAVLAVPHAALVGERPALRPAGPEPHQVLLIHGEVEGVLPADRSSVEYGGAVVAPREFNDAGWGYVAWGHYHVRHQVGPRAWYAGSLDYTSPNVWGELAEERARGIAGKGWLLVTLPEGTVAPQDVPAPRRFVDLPRFDAAGLDLAALQGAITARVEGVPGGLAEAVARLVVTGVPRHLARELDHERLRAWKAQALHFHLDLRRPEAGRESGLGAPGQRRTLPALVEEYLARRPLPAELDRARFVAAGVEVIAAIEREALEA